MASKQINNTPRMQSKKRKSLMQEFAKTEVHTNVKHWHPFGSLVYVLESELQKQGIFGKWKTQANIGIPWSITPPQQKCCTCPQQTNRIGEPPVPHST
jgi:hypothetical protein